MARPPIEGLCIAEPAAGILDLAQTEAESTLPGPDATAVPWHFALVLVDIVRCSGHNRTNAKNKERLVEVNAVPADERHAIRPALSH